jgi:hypothetical protein
VLKKGLQASETEWQTLKQVYGWVHQVAEVFDEQEPLRMEERQLRFFLILQVIQEQAERLGPFWQKALRHFLKGTQSYAPPLFFCYHIPDLPGTNNDLEQAVGQVRAHERRATGRTGALPGLVVQGAVRLQAALASRLHIFTPAELAPHDLQAWRALRAQVASRQQSRCKQYRFRKDPPTYLADLEALLLKDCLRS